MHARRPTCMLAWCVCVCVVCVLYVCIGYEFHIHGCWPGSVKCGKSAHYVQVWPHVCWPEACCTCSALWAGSPGQGVDAAFCCGLPAQVGLWPSAALACRELSSGTNASGAQEVQAAEQQGRGPAQAGLAPSSPSPCAPLQPPAAPRNCSPSADISASQSPSRNNTCAEQFNAPLPLQLFSD